MRRSSPPTDADLLSSYLQAGDERAFAALVRAHERLVIGTAARITGNAELARDVAQQVFAALAQKGWLLTDRMSLSGWLHHAARNIALRMARSEAARQRRHEQAARLEHAAPESDVWPLLEEALAALPAVEREAVVMHHLQDRQYSEMASVLGVTEAAARKRVSRGLKKLGAQLRRRGVGGSAAALLASAAALQIGAPSAAVAATCAAAVPLSLTLTTLMAHTAVKLAAVIALAAAVPIAWQTRANNTLRDQLAALQIKGGTLAPQSISARDNSALRSEAAALSLRLASAHDTLAEARTRLEEAQETARRLNEEVVISHGRIEDLARSTMKRWLPVLQAMVEFEKLNADERVAKEAELVAQLGPQLIELIPAQRVMLKLEDRPTDAARFFSTALSEAMNLPAGLRRQVEDSLLADFEQLKSDGLNFSQHPETGEDTWIARRLSASLAMQAHINAILPPGVPKHPFLEVKNGFLNSLHADGLGYLDDDVKAAPAAKP